MFFFDLQSQKTLAKVTIDGYEYLSLLYVDDTRKDQGQRNKSSRNYYIDGDNYEKIFAVTLDMKQLRLKSEPL